MRVLLLLLATMAIFIEGNALAQERKWMPISSEEAKCSIEMPGTPKTIKKPRLENFTLLLPNNRQYALILTVLPKTGLTQAQFFEEVEKGFARQWKVLDTRKVILGKHTGRELLIKIGQPKQMYLRNRVFLVGDRVYQIMVRDAGIEEVYNAGAKRYYGSFKFLP